MKIKDTTFIAFSIPDEDKLRFVQRYVVDKGTRDPVVSKLNAAWAIKCMQETNVNYIFSQKAKDIIDLIKIQKSLKTEKMVFQSAEESATIIVNDKSFFRYYHENEVISIFFAGVIGKRVTHKTYNINKGWFSRENHMDIYLENFLRLLILIKCTNSEIINLKSSKIIDGNSVKVGFQKYQNNSSHDIKIVHTEHKGIQFSGGENFVAPTGYFSQSKDGIEFIIKTGYKVNGGKDEPLSLN